jgi:hypothetical protein
MLPTCTYKYIQLFLSVQVYLLLFLETVLILFFRSIMMYFLFRQGGFDANSTSYLRKIQRSINEKDA